MDCIRINCGLIESKRIRLTASGTGLIEKNSAFWPKSSVDSFSFKSLKTEVGPNSSESKSISPDLD